MNILVTGANGQLGNEMRRISIGSDDRYLYTDVAELDIADQDAVRSYVKKEAVDVIVNCAAYTNVDKAEDDAEKADLLNNYAVGNLAIAAKEVDATLIHISTDYVFGGSQTNTPYREDAVTNPLGVYGKTKLSGEQVLQRTGCQYLIFRTAWLYSSYGNNFVKTMMRLTREKDMLNVVFDQVGTPTYAGDLAAVIYKVISQRLYNDHQGIYHFSNEGVISWYDFALAIAELSGHRCNIRPCHSDEFPSKVKRPNFSVLDKTKVKETFHVDIPYWRDSLRKCINEIQEV
ncbi:MAG: dTDP-4-dehydrorhamnose reductase [Bacteroidales bacterium]|nr:dTDP-4-dehydrorhamnose reductase [Bacteroidales bacterium]